MRHLALATTRFIGIVLITLGVLGLFLPFLQGILFLAVGLYMYSFSSPRLRARLDLWIAPYPRLVAVCSGIDCRVRRVFRLD